MEQILNILLECIVNLFTLDYEEQGGIGFDKPEVHLEGYVEIERFFCII